MALEVFVDTWGWLTLMDDKETRHKEINAFYQELRTQNGRMATSDYVLDETITLLFRRLPFVQARDSLQRLDRAIREGYLQLERITPERFGQAKTLRLQLQDKPRISFTDLSSVVVMDGLGITQVLSEDAHFTQIGRDLRLVP